MGARVKIIATHDVANVAADLQSQGLTAQNGKAQHINWLQNHLNRIVGGASNATVVTTIDKGDGVYASSTVTFSSLANNDTVTVSGVVFTAKTSGASGQAQFNLGANDTAAAVNFAAAVNAHTSLTGICTASPAAAVTTITAYEIGPLGNLVTLAISAHGSVGAATLANGALHTGSSSVSYSFGL